MSFVSKVFPEELVPSEEIEKRYSDGGLPDDAFVTRIGPSPTGMMHIGTQYVGLLNSMLARQSGGCVILRIEDTDKLREVDGASSFIAESLRSFGIDFDESPFDKHGFAARPKDFKRNPEAYKGSVANAAQVFRVLLTGSPTSPDLFSVMQVMGPDRLQRRLSIGLSS